MQQNRVAFLRVALSNFKADVNIVNPCEKLLHVLKHVSHL